LMAPRFFLMALIPGINKIHPGNPQITTEIKAMTMIVLVFFILHPLTLFF
jgi:hypothetical protein